MAIQVNLVSAKVLLTGNNLAVSAFDSADVTEIEDHDDRSYESSRSASNKTWVDEDCEVGPMKSTSWIAGVGDICNGISSATDFHTNSISKRTDQNENSSTSPRIFPPEQPTALANSDCNQGNSNTKRSALQRHCDFWDTDHDGLIYPWDIFVGFRKLGFNIALCLWAAVSMAICSSYCTQTSWLPHPLFAINLDNINCNRHGSTTGAYDMDAELDMRRFEAIFTKYANGKNYLTGRNLYDVWRGQCCANDWFGWFAGGLECKQFCRAFFFLENFTTDYDKGLQCTFYFGHKMGKCARRMYLVYMTAPFFQGLLKAAHKGSIIRISEKHWETAVYVVAGGSIGALLFSLRAAAQIGDLTYVLEPGES